MPTSPEACANYQINLQMCPCTSENCANRGLCCECVQAHYNAGAASACMRGVERLAASMALAAQAVACQTNQPRNAEFCLCSAETCGNRGVCCSCVRNHFTADGAGRVACMKGF